MAGEPAGHAPVGAAPCWCCWQGLGHLVATRWHQGGGRHRRAPGEPSPPRRNGGSDAPVFSGGWVGAGRTGVSVWGVQAKKGSLGSQQGAVHWLGGFCPDVGSHAGLVPLRLAPGGGQG